MTKIRPATQMLIPGDATKYLDGTGAFSTPAGGGGAGGGPAPLAVVRYAPSPQVTYTATSSTVTDLDSVNLAATVTAPVSGKVLVRLSGLVQGAASTTYAWCIRSGTTQLGDDLQAVYNMPSSAIRATGDIYITGLTAGSSYTLKWGHRLAFGSGSSSVTAYPADGLLMQVWDAAFTSSATPSFATLLKFGTD